MNLLLAYAQIGVLKSGTNGVHIKGHNLLMIFGSLIWHVPSKDMRFDTYVLVAYSTAGQAHRGGNAPVAASVRNRSW